PSPLLRGRAAAAQLGAAGTPASWRCDQGPHRSRWLRSRDHRRHPQPLTEALPTRRKVSTKLTKAALVPLVAVLVAACGSPSDDSDDNTSGNGGSGDSGASAAGKAADEL